ncbi:hypothetical protein [Pedobacter antarcticus]|uniref:hypothetical protein n=1 Tax=Pedobacter antarcticus TaxID=34086 RepID=UPI000885758B|nr:hypothetical protein [Pedobacter antarcticus]SDL40430.1 hypothetical protein SAMN04488084_101177 [Pedobacter antarcticus]
MKRALSLLSITLCMTVLFIACKKNKDGEPNHELVNRWQEKLSGGFTRTLIFSSDGKFSMEFAGGDENSVVNGKYIVNGNSLKVNLTESLSKLGTSNVVRTKIDYELFEKGTYKIEGSVLIIQYISYPADAPVQTETEYTLTK